MITDVQEDKKKPKFDDVDISDLVPEEEAEELGEAPEPEIIEKRPTKREKLDKKRKIEEYLDEHLPLNVPLAVSYQLTIATEILISL